LARPAELTAHERATLQDACYGTLRFLGEIDAVLDALLDKPLRNDKLRHLLRVAVYQLAHTRTAPHAVVDHAVRACVAEKHAAAKGLVNAVLRAFLRERAAVLARAHEGDVGRYSHPQWWVDKLRGQYPDDHSRMLDAANQHPPLTLRVNVRRTTVDEYMAELANAGVAARRLEGAAVTLERAMPVERIPRFAEGWVSVQDASAQLAAPLLALAAGQRVLDACAAPGGKSAHILELADVDLTSLDNDAARLDRIRSNLDRLQLRSRIVCGDAAAPAAWWDGVPYDRILADVPCSASGVVRRHPDIKWLRRPSDIERFAERQSGILDALWRLLRPGGKFVYSTCSVFREENHEQIARFLTRHENARHLPFSRANAYTSEPGGQIFPDERHDGFFYALLQKV
jgi:16S rRNA (cytosine967-C5)-methyltransferase